MQFLCRGHFCNDASLKIQHFWLSSYKGLPYVEYVPLFSIENIYLNILLLICTFCQNFSFNL